MAWQKSSGAGPVINLVTKYDNLDVIIPQLLGNRPTSADLESFPYNVYSFIIKSLRNLDQDTTVGGSRLLYRFLMGANEIFYNLKNKVTTLKTLFNPNTINIQYLDSLLELVGFTKELGDIPTNANEIEKRRLAAGATEFWKHTLQDIGVESAIRLVTGNKFKYRDFIDFKNIIGEELITEDLENEDPFLLTLDTLGTFEIGADGITQFGGVPTQFGQTGSFIFTPDFVGADLVITDSPLAPANNGYYEITNVNVGAQIVTVATPFPVAEAGSVTFSVFFPYNEYIQELRIADYVREYDGVVSATSPDEFVSASASFSVADLGSTLRILNSPSGQNGSWEIIRIINSTTVQLKNAIFLTDESNLLWSYTNESINRILLEKLLELQRPASERINVVYLDMLDTFVDRGDLSQWDSWEPGATKLDTISVDEGVLTLEGNATTLAGVMCNKTYTEEFESIHWRSKIKLDSVGTFYLIFSYKDINNYRYARINYSGGATGIIQLHSIVGGAPTAYGSPVSLPLLRVGDYWTYTITQIHSGSGNNVYVEIDNVLVCWTTLMPNHGTGDIRGSIIFGLAAITDITVAETELFRPPLIINRVGPNP